MSKEIKNKKAGHNNQEPRPKGKMKKSVRWGALLVIFLIGFGAYNFIQEYQNYLDLKGEVAVYQAQLTAEEQSYAGLQTEKTLLFDDSYLEKMAREDLGMIKSGETLVLPMEKSLGASDGQAAVPSGDIH